MLNPETAREIIRQKENLDKVSRITGHVNLHDVKVGYENDSYECWIEPPEELLLPFLDKCEKYVLAKIKELNQQAKKELNDVDV